MEPSLFQEPDPKQLASHAVTHLESLDQASPQSAHHYETRAALEWLADNHAHLDDTQAELFAQASRLHRIADHVALDANKAVTLTLESITETKLAAPTVPDQPPYLGVGLLNQHAYLVLKQRDRMTGRIVGISATDPMNDDDESTPGVQYMVLEIPVNQP